MLVFFVLNEFVFVIAKSRLIKICQKRNDSKSDDKTTPTCNFVTLT